MQLLRPILQTGHFHVRTFNTTSKLALIQKWRQERGLPLNPTSNGELTQGHDYTFLDGRVTPYGSRQRARMIKQNEIKENIIKLCGEIDFAVERHQKLLEDEENKKKSILNRKLKPKGKALLKSK